MRPISTVGLRGEVTFGDTGYLHADNRWNGAADRAAFPDGTEQPGISTAYSPGDTVVHSGSIWVANYANDNVMPGGVYDRAGTGIDPTPAIGDPTTYWTEIGGAGGTFGVRDEVTEEFNNEIFFRLSINTGEFSFQLRAGNVDRFLTNFNIPDYDTALTQEIRLRLVATNGRETTLAAPVGTTFVVQEQNNARLRLVGSPPPGTSFQLTGTGRLSLFNAQIASLEFLRDFVISSGNPRITDNVSNQNSIRLSTVDQDTVGIQVADSGILTQHIADSAVTSAKVDATIATQADVRTAGFRSVSVQERIGTGTANNTIPDTQNNQVLTVSLPSGFNAGMQFTPGPANDILVNSAYNRSRDPSNAAAGYPLQTNVVTLATTAGTNPGVTFSRDANRSQIAQAYAGEAAGSQWSSINTVLIAPYQSQLNFFTAATVGDTLIAYANRDNWAIWRIDAVTENVGQGSNPTTAAHVSAILSAGGPTATTGTNAPLFNGVIPSSAFLVIVPGETPSTATFQSSTVTSADAYRATVEPAIFRFDIDTGNLVYNTTNFTDAPSTVVAPFTSGANNIQALTDIGTALEAAYGSARRVVSTFPTFLSAEPIVETTSDATRRFNLRTLEGQNINNNLLINGAVQVTTAGDASRTFPFTVLSGTVTESFDGGNVSFSTYTVTSPTGASVGQTAGAPPFSFSFTVATNLDFNSTLQLIVGNVNSARSQGIMGAGSTWEAQLNASTNGLPNDETTGIVFIADDSVAVADTWTIAANHGTGGGGDIAFPNVNILSVGDRRLTGVDADTETPFGILTGVPSYPRNQPTAVNSAPLTTLDAIPYNVAVNRRTDNTGPAVSWEPASVVRAVPLASYRDVPNVTINRPGMMSVAMFEVDNMTNEITENNQFFDLRVEANETLPDNNARLPLRHLRVGGVVYDIPAGNTETELVLSPTTPLAAFAGDQTITYTATAASGSTTVRDEPITLSITDINGDPQFTSVMPSVASNTTITFEIPWPNQVALNQRYTIRLNAPLRDSNGEIHNTTVQETITVMDMRPAVTITPPGTTNQDRRRHGSAATDLTDTWTINFGTAVGSLAAGTRNAYESFTIERSTDGGSTYNDVVGSIGIAIDETTGINTFELPRLNIADTDMYRINIADPAATGVLNPNAQPAVIAAERPTFTLDRFISYSYATYATAASTAPTVFFSTESIANGRSFTIRNSSTSTFPIILTVAIDQADGVISTSPLNLITANGNRLVGQRTGADLVNGGPVDTFSTNRNVAVGANAATSGLNAIQWNFGLLAPGDTETYTFGGINNG